MYPKAVQVCLGLPRRKPIEAVHEQAKPLIPGGLAQLARAPALQAGGQRFESVILHPPRRTVCAHDVETIFEMMTQARL